MIIGVAGKIAAGKSEFLKILKKRGFYCIDADKIVHDLYESGQSGAKKVEAVFGGEFLNPDGSVNRFKLRDAVFLNADMRKYLENIIHPEVYEEIKRLLAKHEGENVAIEATYFDANSLGDFLDKIVWIERSKTKIIKTLMKERGMTEELAIAAYDIIEEPFRVDLTVTNNDSLSDLEEVDIMGAWNLKQ